MEEGKLSWQKRESHFIYEHDSGSGCVRCQKADIITNRTRGCAFFQPRTEIGWVSVLARIATARFYLHHFQYPRSSWIEDLMNLKKVVDYIRTLQYSTYQARA